MSLSKKKRAQLSREGIAKALYENSFSKTEQEIFLAQGAEIELQDDNRYRFKTTREKINDATFCIVDIETNGSKTDKHQIIEIGALKIRGGKIIDTFETLVHCNDISEHITEITGIDTRMTQNAPKLCDALAKFKHFLSTAVFVAHDVKFDYGFISAMLERCGYERLLNRRLCTIDLAERTIASHRYGLSYLNESLALHKEATHHRALSDAVTAARLFLLSLNALPTDIKRIEELIRFSKEGKKLKIEKKEEKSA